MIARRFYEVPTEAPANHILNPMRGWMSVIKPIARTNLVTNPSIELATTGYTAVGASISRSSAQQYHGAYSLDVTMSGPSAATDGVYYGTVSLTSGTTYAFSLKFLDPRAGRPYKISFATTGGVDLVTYKFRSTGKWQWIWIIWTETSTTTRRLYVTKDSSTHTGDFYIDGVQCEACETGNYWPTTYIDGDQLSLIPGQFPAPYGWNGSRHASTSYRLASTRDGGQVRNFDTFKFLLTAITGLGLVTPAHIVSVTPGTDGASYQTSYSPSREFTLEGLFNTKTNIELDQIRRELYDVINLDATPQRQSIVLLYQKYAGLTPQSDTGKIIASYKDGLAGNSSIRQSTGITFVQWLPFIAGAEQGAALSQNTSIAIATAYALMYRDNTGTWSALATANDVIKGIARHSDGTYYVCGLFTSIGGTAANRIAKYDPTTGTWSALGTGLSGLATKVAIAPNGDVYVTGSFATAGGVTVNNVARWDGAAWNALGSGGTKGVDARAEDLVFSGDGTAYFTGSFLNAGGAGAVKIVKYTPSTNGFSAMGTGLTGGDGISVAVGLDQNVYATGSFTAAGGVANTLKIARWDGSTWNPLGTGLGDIGDVVEVGPDGSIYVGGVFTTASGVTVNHTARWNGSNFFPLGSGVSGGGSYVTEIEFAGDGLMYIGGELATVNGIAITDGFAAWNGTSWILPDLDMPGTSLVTAMEHTPQGGFLVAFSSSIGTVTAAVTTTLTNGGTAPAYPTLTITGPASGTTPMYQLRSYTTNEIISFKNFTINTGETITIRMTPSGTTITSSFRGDITSLIAPGSSKTITLLKGTNIIACFATGSAITIAAVWQKLYESADGLSY